MVIEKRLINLSGYEDSDLKFSNTNGNMMIIQLDTSATITVKGGDVSSSTLYNLGAINMSDFSVVTSISAPGLYGINILGIDAISLEVSGGSGSNLLVKVVS